MNIEEAMAKAHKLRKTNIPASASISMHGKGINGNAFTMCSVHVDGVGVAGKRNFEDCFAEIERELPAKLERQRAQLKAELAEIEGVL